MQYYLVNGSLTDDIEGEASYYKTRISLANNSVDDSLLM